MVHRRVSPDPTCAPVRKRKAAPPAAKTKAKATAKAVSCKNARDTLQTVPRGSVSGSAPSARDTLQKVPTTVPADTELWDGLFGGDDSQECTEQTNNWGSNWCLNLDGVHYWRRGNEYWTYIRPGRGQNRGLALWEVFEIVHSGNGTEMRLMFKALLPESWNPPPPAAF